MLHKTLCIVNVPVVSE